MKIDERKIRTLNPRGLSNPGLKADAERLAIAALGFMAEDTERLDRFMALSGLTPDSLRQAAIEPGFLGAVLEYMCSDEPLLLDFAAHQRCDPMAVAQARQALTGGEMEMS